MYEEVNSCNTCGCHWGFITYWCGVSNKSHDNTQVGTTENSSDEAKNKEVKMHVWCSKDDVDITTQMIESFKEANKGTILI